MPLLKQLAKMLGCVRAIPHLIECWIAIAILGQPRALSVASERVARVPGILGIYTRQAFYRAFLKHVGTDVHFGFMTLLSKPDIRIGDRVYLGRCCTIGWADIGDEVIIADHVQILSGRHQHGREAVEGHPLHDNPQEFTHVTIGSGAWIGAGAIVMADVGENAIVGAGSVVVHPVPAGAKVAGVPAKPMSPHTNDPHAGHQLHVAV